MRQHYACSGGVCKHLKKIIIQKLPGSGRISEQTENFTIGQINPVITNILKKFEDNWIRKLLIYVVYHFPPSADARE